MRIAGERERAAIALAGAVAYVSAAALAAGPEAGPPIASSPRPVGRDWAMVAPDPPPLRESNQVVMSFRYEAGKVTLASVRAVHLSRPRTTIRNTGRFAIELLSGQNLVERVRFDFPLLGADELAGKPERTRGPVRFETRATVRIDVMVPDSSRVSWARVVDRAGPSVLLRLPWPPEFVPDAGLTESGTGIDSARDSFTADAKPDD